MCSPPVVWHYSSQSVSPTLDLLSQTYRRAQPGLPNSLFASTFRSVFRWQGHAVQPMVAQCTNWELVVEHWNSVQALTTCHHGTAGAATILL